MKVLENPFGCSVCRKPFSDPYELAEHVKIAHNNSLNNSMVSKIKTEPETFESNEGILFIALKD